MIILKRVDDREEETSLIGPDPVQLLEMHLHRDSDIHEVTEAVAAFLIGCGYHPDSVVHGFQGYVSEHDSED